MTIFSTNNKGSMLVLVLIASGLFSVIAMGAVSLALLEQKLSIKKVASNQALHVAEAGVNYYRWVLYHDSDEYCNKEACIPDPYGPYGPYDYTDASGNIIGKYELYITPPAINGSTVVNIKSVGWIESQEKVKRTIEVKCGIPSWSTYSTLCNENIRFGSGTEVWGPIHSNAGIRFDGLAHNLISSTILDYADPDHQPSPNEFAVHTHLGTTDPLPDGNNPPLNLPDRSDVFMAGRSFPVPSISFDLLNSHINSSYGLATSSGIMLENSGAQGYNIIISPNPGEANDTINIYKVTNITGTCGGRDTFGINNQSLFLSTTTPSNGVIFIKDRLWIEGQVDEDRLTILAFKDPFSGDSTDIIFNNDLTYTNYDGRDSIGVIAQSNILIGLYSQNDLHLDAALIAKEGRVGRNYYGGGCGAGYIRNSITVTGSMATRERYGFAYTDGTGYITRNLIYDNNLTFIPPPHFPTTGEYTFISWDEK